MAISPGWQRAPTANRNWEKVSLRVENRHRRHHCASVLSPPGLFHLYHDKQAGMQHRNQGNPFGLLSKGRHGPVVSVGRLLGVPAGLLFPPVVHNCLIAIEFETVFQHSQRASELKRLLEINLSQLPVIVFPLSLSRSLSLQKKHNKAESEMTAFLGII